MPRYRNDLPQLNGETLITDGGLETVLVFHEGCDLPEFASFPLLDEPQGLAIMERYFRRYTEMAERHGVGLLLESTTWRANPDWMAKIGCPEDLERINHAAIEHLVAVREAAGMSGPVVLSGCIGPRGDGYVADNAMSADQATDYHAHQVRVLADTKADQVTAMTFNYAAEAIGLARAAKEAGIPAAISFTVETDGRLPTGQPLGETIQEVDEATDSAPAYYMINCAHPTHFDDVLTGSEPWIGRLLGLRANASACSHAELDAAEELDEGDPEDFGHHYVMLTQRLPHLRVLGGCCGTDHRHIGAICAACLVSNG
ncbi:Bifunctional homocysteine S-methyltransferase/5,10-methylenetetrahydrofolate reductase [Pseudobythopirellula maris]|uniref:Bifunctional homocysteine S-methyltransferase/5,10-methylenetetrahydrofolate reductase n=1 Tax=Pseudobythopirellula maris TaxID=2527991 RepID=A0A5C5ZU58_9BACT|nr:homocysteine S-methyltransferase family protein [Pseudobythopirellula maris]TWT90736.1 Bifunctional homocysteine S-methyltransferase/5,10-methylenetetrahydrofolate reductase [Pseudobythopirellula maris]